MNNIKLELISKKREELLEIAKWRNKCMESLRSISYTPVSFYHQSIWIENMTEQDKYFFIYDSVNNKFIGYCGLDKICHINNSAEISLLIGIPYYGKGYGKATVKKLLHYAFVTLKLNCLFIEVYKTTNKFEGFWNKLGFRKEGILRQRKYWNGKYYDSIIASMLSHEYYKSKGIQS